jgi:HSP20 family protein
MKLPALKEETMNIPQPEDQRQLTAEMAGQPSQPGPYATPIVDVESTPAGYVLHAEMPGVNKAGIEVSIENGDLTLVGRRAPLEVSGELVHRESRPDDFRRTYELDPSIDTSRITARIENGVLTVDLPKAESVKPRRIEVE